MKRVTIWLFVTCLTFVVGVTAVLLCLHFINPNIQKSTISDEERIANDVPSGNKETAGDLPAISFCEISTNPQKYDKQIVRTTGIMLFGTEGAWFSASKCSTSKGSTLVSLLLDEATWKSIEAAMKQKNRLPAHEINVTVVGKFKNEDSENCCIIATSHFDVLKIEKVSGINQAR